MVKVVDKNLNNELRFERKFIFSKIHLNDLIQKLYLNSFCFTEIFEERKINNVYFDDNDLSFYRQNVIGVGERLKYRLRWYGQDFSLIENPTIEIKKKKGEVGDKVRHKFTNFSFNLDANTPSELQNMIINRLEDNLGMKNKFYQLQPALLSSYERRYFLSFCGRYRVTLDYNQEFFNPNYINYKDSRRTIDQSTIVLELKYSINEDVDSRIITQQFNTRLSKNSKYVQGIDFIHDQITF